MDWRQLNLMQRALLLSIGLHAGLLTLRFASPQTWQMLTQETPLEVTIVNASTGEAPEKAQALAQVSLAGGGAADVGMASSAVAAGLDIQSGDSTARATSDEQQNLQNQQSLLLQRVRAQILALNQAPETSTQTLDEKIRQEQKRMELSRILARIEERIQAENARPRKAYVSPSVREVVYASYYDAMRRKIEARGTSHFPESKGGASIEPLVFADQIFLPVAKSSA
jgi:protein TonB